MTSDKNNVLLDKSLDFAVRIVRLFQFLQSQKHEFILSKQVCRSGTAIGALAREAKEAESDADFVHKLSIALKEARETDYWLVLLNKTEYINDEQFRSVQEDCIELVKILTVIIKKCKNKD